MSRTKKMPAETPSPVEIAFVVAQRRASTSAVVGLREAALNLAQDDFVDGVDATRAALTRANRAAGIDDDEENRTAERDEAAYLYGLAVGVALGKGGAR